MDWQEEPEREEEKKEKRRRSAINEAKDQLEPRLKSTRMREMEKKEKTPTGHDVGSHASSGPVL